MKKESPCGVRMPGRSRQITGKPVALPRDSRKRPKFGQRGGRSSIPPGMARNAPSGCGYLRLPGFSGRPFRDSDPDARKGSFPILLPRQRRCFRDMRILPVPSGELLPGTRGRGCQGNRPWAAQPPFCLRFAAIIPCFSVPCLPLNCELFRGGSYTPVQKERKRS